MSRSSLRNLLHLTLCLGLGACSAGGGDSATGDNAGSGGNGGNGGNGGDDAGASGGGNGGNGGNGSGMDAAVVGCYDQDEDGFGLNCAPGPDCNDKDPNVGGYEICDGKDNDCDGKVDEFLKDVCTSCTSECAPENEPNNATGWTPPAQKPASDAQDVILDDDGALTLSRDEAQAHAVWVANTGDLDDHSDLPVYARGSVSKLDSKTNRELARYISVLPSMVSGVDMGGSTPNPSRTAVDQRFDAYVANRAHNQNTSSQATVTKYANELRDCVDRNMDGMIQTSHDENGDGQISVDPDDPQTALEFFGADDECILWTVTVGEKGEWARALAVGIAPPDGDVGDIYVGLHLGEEVCRLSADTGASQNCTSTPGFRSYGAASDAKGRVWFVSRDATNKGFGFLNGDDSWTYITTMPNCGGKSPDPYGITVDADNRVYFAASNCDTEHVFRYDHDNGGAWDKVSVPNGGTGRGVAVDRQHLWVAVSGSGTNDWANDKEDRIIQYDLATLTHVATHNMPHGRAPVGIGVSFDGSVWAINQKHENAGGLFATGVGVATRFEPSIAQGQPGRWIERGVGKHPYTYSDFIGFGLNTFADPKGFYRFVIEGCPGQSTQWRGVQIDADIPPMTAVKINVRSANSEAELKDAAWVGPFTAPAELVGVPPGAYLEVEVVLSTDDQSVAPRVRGVEIIRECMTIIQ